MVIYDKNIIGYINLFENLTNARVKDCFAGNELTFVMQEGEAGKAIGKKGKNLKKISGLLNKKIKVIEFNNDVRLFVRNLISPLEGEIELNEKTVNIKMPNSSLKAMLIGRDRQNIKRLQDIVRKYFDVTLEVS